MSLDCDVELCSKNDKKGKCTDDSVLSCYLRSRHSVRVDKEDEPLFTLVPTGKTLTEMLNNKGCHYESMDEGTVMYVSDAKEVFKEWLGTVGLPWNVSGEAVRQLLVILVDEP